MFSFEKEFDFNSEAINKKSTSSENSSIFFITTLKLLIQDLEKLSISNIDSLPGKENRIHNSFFEISCIYDRIFKDKLKENKNNKQQNYFSIFSAYFHNLDTTKYIKNHFIDEPNQEIIWILLNIFNKSLYDFFMEFYKQGFDK